MDQIANKWKDYEIIDTGNKEKLERWNDIILRRPILFVYGQLKMKQNGINVMPTIIVQNQVVAIGK